MKCSKCDKEIVFLKTAKGKSMPTDAETVKPGETMFDSDLHTSHFATCPAAASFRKPKP